MMERRMILEEYSHDRRFRFQVFEQGQQFEVHVQKQTNAQPQRIGELFDYADFPGTIRTSEHCDQAVEAGRNILNTLSPPTGKPRIELNGTLRERVDQAVKLSRSDVSEEEIGRFCSVYAEAGIPLLPSAVRFYKTWGGIFRTHRLALSDPLYDRDVSWFFYAGSGNSPQEKKEAIQRLRDAAEFGLEEAREFAQQEVSPLGEFGFYYPPAVYIDPKGKLYCIFEYKEEMEVFLCPEEILASQLGRLMPAGLESR